MSSDKTSEEMLLEIKLNQNPRTWSLADRPDTKQSHAKDYHLRSSSHPPAQNFCELASDHQRALIKIAEQIRSVYPAAEIYVFGSIVNGNFKEDSDYDIVVSSDYDSIYSRRIRSLKFKEKVDLKFSSTAIYPVSIP